ncbi:MAG: NYN domain-containing protein [Candidatus Hodarchaeales archaeon]|jgi:uncharacterized LabA/DUF88 family protein
MSEDITQKKLAVLIDADNAKPSILDDLLSEIAKYGISSVKRIYGDWTTPQMRSWKELLVDYAIQPMQQFRYTVGKNATDSAMIIDAMDLLYTEKLDGFCLVSSDSDFTRLASRIRESGLFAYGFGEKKTPKSFVGACDKFIYIENILKEEVDHPPRKVPVPKLKSDTKLITLLRSAIEASADESGWAHLGNVGTNLVTQAPDFDPRTYGFRKLNELVKAIGLFQIDARKSPTSPSQSIYIKDKRKKERE